MQGRLAASCSNVHQHSWGYANVSQLQMLAEKGTFYMEENKNLSPKQHLSA